MNVSEVSSDLYLDKNGIYIVKDDATQCVSYPDDGNESCYQLEDVSFWFGFRNKCILSIINRFSPSGTLIDIGGGNGYVTRAVLDSGFDAALLEPGYSGALNGKNSRNIKTVICATLENARFKESSISAFGCFDVIEHIENDVAFINELYKALIPGGYLYITVPAHNWLWSSSDITAKHFRRYNKASIESLFNSNYKIEYFTYFFGILIIPILLFRTLPYLLFKKKRSSVFNGDVEHGASKGRLISLINRVLNFELSKINRGLGVLLGSSCLLVVKKVQ